MKTASVSTAKCTRVRRLNSNIASRLPVSGRSHFPMRVAALQLRFEPTRSGIDDGIPGRAVKLRNHPSLVRYVRSFLCCQAERRRPKLGDKWLLDEVFLK